MDIKEIQGLLARIEKHAIETSHRTERLEIALVGDPSMGNKGVIKRIEDVEKEIEKVRKAQQVADRKMVVLGAAGTGAIFGIKGVWDKIVNLL
tara:strand:+ start:756 stop:1034 length:279 start_codon:yes stop_codon:yes gene_type:complete